MRTLRLPGGELKEQRLAHREGAEEFYRALAARGKQVRVGMEASGHTDRWGRERRVSSPVRSLSRAIRLAHKPMQTHFESGSGKGDRSKPPETLVSIGTEKGGGSQSWNRTTRAPNREVRILLVARAILILSI